MNLLASFSMYAFLESVMKVINALIHILNKLRGFIIIAQSLSLATQNKMFSVNFRSWRLPIVQSHLTVSQVFSKHESLILQGKWEKLCYFLSLLPGKFWTYFKRAHLLDQDRLITLLINSKSTH